MSALTVIYRLDNSLVGEETILRLLAKLSHRGADGQGIWTAKNVGLGHRLRWNTPESRYERLPLRDAESERVIISDARVDNREELIAQLDLRGKNAETLTDSEIILAAYQKWGEDCPAKILGDYVFAVWDEKRRKLFCARDPLGVKHFYYYYEPGKIFALASEIKALLELPEVPKTLNEELVSDLLTLNAGEKVETFYKHIKRLPATHALTVTPEAMRIFCYWEPDYDAELKLKSDAEYEEAFRELFSRAVKSRLRSNDKIGSSLSGGLDSSSVVCTASKILREEGKIPLRSFSMIFPQVAERDAAIDERKYMQSAIDHSGCAPTFVEVDRSSPMTELDKWFWYTDHPIGTPNLYMEWSIFKAARENDVKVVLSGTDGDTTVSYGYEDFYQFAKRGNWLRLYKEAAGLKKNFPKRMHSLKASIWKRGFKPVLEDYSKSFAKLLRLKNETGNSILLPKTSKNIPLNPNFAKRIDLEGRFFKLYTSNYPSPEYNRIEDHWRAVTNGGFGFILETFEKLSAAFNIEARYPFFDRKLIEFCIALPPGQKINNGWTRSILRRSMQGILPADVQWRKDKANLSANYKLGMLKYEFEKIEDAIFTNSAVLEEYLDMDAVRNSFRRYESNPLLRGEAETMTIVVAVHLSNWLRQAGFA